MRIECGLRGCAPAVLTVLFLKISGGRSRIERGIEQCELALQRGQALALRRHEIVFDIQFRDAHVPVPGGQALRGFAALHKVRQDQFKMSKLALRELSGPSLSERGDAAD